MFVLRKSNRKCIMISTSNPDWLQNARNQIGSLGLDLILYLDSTMSLACHHMLMSRLARVQAVSHGHPVTTGVCQKYMDYYVSWGASELEYELSKEHYTKKLILLPKEHMHQYYEPRSNDGKSLIDKQSFKHLIRSDFSEYTPVDGNWYLCMQKPFKRHTVFDEMLASILHKDTRGRLLLHGASP